MRREKLFTALPVSKVAGVTIMAAVAVATLIACVDHSLAGAPAAWDAQAAREQMVKSQIEARGVRDAKVLAAMRRVQRHLFVPPDLTTDAYDDSPLRIGHDQTISQPYIVATMTEALQLRGGEKVLEVGTGSGYQAAVLAEIARDVYSIEIVVPLARSAAERLKRLGYDRVRVSAGDGYRGWPEVAPFDAVIVTAAPDHVPQPLIDQLKVGGRLVMPMGPDNAQVLWRLTKTAKGVQRERLLDVRFVPMTGEAQNKPK